MLLGWRHPPGRTLTTSLLVWFLFLTEELKNWSRWNEVTSQNARQPFPICLHKRNSNNKQQTLCFSSLRFTKYPWEKCRLVLVSLLHARWCPTLEAPIPCGISWPSLSYPCEGATWFSLYLIVWVNHSRAQRSSEFLPLQLFPFLNIDQALFISQALCSSYQKQKWEHDPQTPVALKLLFLYKCI